MPPPVSKDRARSSQAASRRCTVSWSTQAHGGSKGRALAGLGLSQAAFPLVEDCCSRWFGKCSGALPTAEAEKRAEAQSKRVRIGEEADAKKTPQVRRFVHLRSAIAECIVSSRRLLER